MRREEEGADGEAVRRGDPPRRRCESCLLDAAAGAAAGAADLRDAGGDGEAPRVWGGACDGGTEFALRGGDEVPPPVRFETGERLEENS